MLITSLLMLLLAIQSPVGAAQELDPIRIQLGVEPAGLNPLSIGDNLSYGLLTQMFETLMQIGPDGKLKSGLAKSYAISRDGLRYTFHLREGAKWSDGQLVTSEDCRRGLLATLDPKSDTDVQLFYAIRNAKSFYTGKVKAEAVGIQASGRDLKIELERPDPAFLNVLTMPSAVPRRAEAHAAWDILGPTNGRYYVKSFKPGVELLLAPNPYNQILGQRPILFKIVTEDIAAQNLFEAGKLDILFSVVPNQAAALDQRGELVQVPSAAMAYLHFNVKKPPFDQLEWRQAVAASIVRQDFTKVLKYGLKPASGLLPRAMSAHADVTVPESFAAAQRRVREYKDKPRITLAYAANPITDLIMQKVQHDLAEKLGADVRLETREWKVYLSQLTTDAPQAFYMSNTGLYDDAETFLNAYTIWLADGHNHRNYSNPKFERLYDEIRRTMDPKRRTRLIHEAEHLVLVEDVVSVPLFEKVFLYGVAKKIRGFKVSPFNVLALDQLRKVE